MVHTLREYEAAIKINRFEEFPLGIGSGMTMLEHFIDFTTAENELKIHIARVILNRNFSWLDGHQVLMDPQWLIKVFLETYQQDLIKPWLTETIRGAMQMITSDDPFVKQIIGSTFMFGVIEYYAKHVLGWRPLTANTFDEYHEPYRKMALGDAIRKLKKTRSLIAQQLNKVDSISLRRFKESLYEEKGYYKPRIADRLTFFRNNMLHGENHNDHSSGPYLCVLYILFHHCELQSAKEFNPLERPVIN